MNKTVTILGLGYIGLPTAALLASVGYKVNGIDINNNIIEKLNSGIVHFKEPGLQNLIDTSIRNGMLKGYLSPQRGDVYIIVVPTPFKEDKSGDISYIIKATESIIPLLKKEDIFIIESTSPVGTTEEIYNLIISKRQDLKNEIYVSYCPERVIPGNTLDELVNNDRVVGGVNEKSAEITQLFYKSFVKGNVFTTHSRTAELCKLTENASRDSQIAFANELSMICDKLNINVNELIDLTNKHPRVNILRPGCGVGGHCIAVDPYFIISDFPNLSPFMQKAREVNLNKERWCVEFITEAIQDFENTRGVKPTIAILGVTYKPNVDDIRESPALRICQELIRELGSSLISIVDPYTSEEISGIIISEMYEATNKADLIFKLVGHSDFDGLKTKPHQKLISFVD